MIVALSFSHYSILVNVNHLCTRRMTWEFQGHAVMLLLYVLLRSGVPIHRFMMTSFAFVEGVVYGAFIWNVVGSIGKVLSKE